MALILLLQSLRTIKISKIIFLIFINNFLLLYFFKPSIFTLINILFVLTTVAAATAVYVVVVTRVGAGFSILFIAFFISQSYPFILLLYFFLSYPINLIIVSN